MRWILRKFKQSIQLRLTSYILVILIPLVIISVFASFQSQRILEEKVNEQTVNSLATIIGSFEMTMQNAEMQAMSMATDPNMINLLKREDTRLTESLTLDFQKVLAQLSSISVSNSNLTLEIYHAYSSTMISSQYGSRFVEGYSKQAWYEQVVQGGGKSVLLIPKKGDFDVIQRWDPAFREGNVTLMLPMDPFIKFGEKHIIMVTVGNAYFTRDLQKLVHSKNESAFLLAGDGTLIAGTAPSEKLSQWDGSSKDMLVRKSELTGEQELMVRYRSVASGWSVILVKPADTMYAETNKLRLFTYAIIGVSLLLALIVSWVVYRGISAPLASLAHGMKQLRIGRLDTSLPGKREDEFGFLMNAFNQMAQEQKHLIEDIYEQQLLRLKAELRVLQSQINPHFLYNTLDTMYSMAENYGAEEIGEMALNLSKFFRLSLSKGQEEFTVEETVRHLHYYLCVQQLRFVDKLSVKVNVEEACKSIPVLKLLLQPLVENAILHGLEKKSKGGVVCIDCRLDHGMLRLEVADNGKGMTLERLAYIQSELGKLSVNTVKGLRQDHKSRTELYGLWNVKARLKLYYGEGSDLTIDSRENAGTTVIVYIPLGGAHESDDR